VLGNVSMGLHHKLCHTLGGTFDLPHAEVHTVVLPHALAYNAAAAPEAMRAIARALGPPTPRARRRPASSTSREARCAGRAARHRHAGRRPRPRRRPRVQNQYPNPRPLERAAIRELLQRAFDGTRPD
jgi:alcohol dehydrogenase class IV